MKALVKDSFVEIKNTFKRFLSILLIVLLGVGFFTGIKATSPDMKNTVDRYFDEQNGMDLQIISTLGLTKNDIEEIQKLEKVEKVEGSYSKDVLIQTEEEEVAVKVHSVPKNINLVKVIEGRLPENANECVVEKRFLAGLRKENRR